MNGLLPALFGALTVAGLIGMAIALRPPPRPPPPPPAGPKSVTEGTRVGAGGARST